MKFNYFLIATLALIACISVCMAAPVTDAATGVSNRAVTMNMHGAVGACWYEWGGTGNLLYSTGYLSTCGAYEQWGAPLLSSTVYDVRACDTTGCGNTVAFTTSAATVSNRTYYGTGVLTMMKSGMNVTQVMTVILEPYNNTITMPVTWGMLFLFIFLGLWIKPKDITIPLILALISGAAIWSGTSALGIPPEFADIGQGLMYAAVAGLVFSWFTK
jgi:hypothetical protein